LVINNLEFDHADIFDDLAAIQTQFHHLIRCVPSGGKIVAGEGEGNRRCSEARRVDASRAHAIERYEYLVSRCPDQELQVN
jgi:UDP-N-acetylmuramate-alanine ligase